MLLLTHLKTSNLQKNPAQDLTRIGERGSAFLFFIFSCQVGAAALVGCFFWCVPGATRIVWLATTSWHGSRRSTCNADVRRRDTTTKRTLDSLWDDPLCFHGRREKDLRRSHGKCKLLEQTDPGFRYLEVHG